MKHQLLLSLLLTPFFCFAQDFNLKKEFLSGHIEVHNRTIQVYENNGIALDAQESDGLALINNASFESGTVEFEIKGENNPGKSFVGFAYNIQNDSTYEAIYFRPFNFVAKEAIRRSHMVQYIHHPGFTWFNLRENRTDEFENEISSPPDPDGWFSVKLIVSEKEVEVFIEGRKQPELSVERLATSKSDRIGFWTGFGSSGRFKNLRVTKE